MTDGLMDEEMLPDCLRRWRAWLILSPQFISSTITAQRYKEAKIFCMLLAKSPVELPRMRTKNGKNDNGGAESSSESSEDVAGRSHQTHSREVKRGVLKDRCEDEAAKKEYRVSSEMAYETKFIKMDHKDQKKS